MGTKNQPGRFDCYNAAEPDEPMFVLLGRDRHAATLVRVWALLRSESGEDEEKVAEALACADAMQQWRREHHKREATDQERLRIEAVLIGATAEMEEHPEGYDDACDCKLCRSYA